MAYFTGFGYDFDALNSEARPNELNDAFAAVFQAVQWLDLISVLSASIPILCRIVCPLHQIIPLNFDLILRL